MIKAKANVVHVLGNDNVWYLKYYNMFKLAVLIVLILELYIYLLISKECARLLILVPHDCFTI